MNRGHSSTRSLHSHKARLGLSWPIEKEMKVTVEHNERIAKLTFASVYPHYVTKVEKKGRTKEELHKVIKWLTSFDEEKLQELIVEKATFEIFSRKQD
jgi:hypothetical protein